MISEIVLVNGVTGTAAARLWRQEADAWARVSNAMQQILSFPQSGEFIQIPGFINRIWKLILSQ